MARFSLNNSGTGPIGPEGPVGPQGPESINYVGVGWYNDVSYQKNDTILYIFTDPFNGLETTGLLRWKSEVPSVPGENDPMGYTGWVDVWDVLGYTQQGIAGEQGPAGADGAPGADGAQGEVGYPAFLYDPRRTGTDQYKAGSIVEFGGSYFIALFDNDAVPPLGDPQSGTYWAAYSFVGPQGEQGLPGDTGPQGAPGADGADGLNGDSAYQVAVSNGFTGTEAEWLTSLIGATGPQGEPGVSGTTSSVSHEVKAGEAVTKGQAVYVSSADGTNMIISKADNSAESTSSKTLGLISTTLAHNGIGYVITEGLLAGLDTSTATAGDPVWLGENGNLIFGLTNKPSAPKHLVFLGVVTRSNLNNGEIFVKPQNGFELQELHTVSLDSQASIGNNELLAFDSSSGLWKNQTASEAGFATVATSGDYSDLSNQPTLVTNLNSLSDVTITGTPTNQQLIVYNTVNGQWENKDPIASTGIAYKAGIPASKTSTGTAGQISIDSANGVMYVCTQTNTWQKVSLNGANFTNAGGFA